MSLNERGGTGGSSSQRCARPRPECGERPTKAFTTPQGAATIATNSRSAPKNPSARGSMICLSVIFSPGFHERSGRFQQRARHRIQQHRDRSVRSPVATRGRKSDRGKHVLNEGTQRRPRHPHPNVRDCSSLRSHRTGERQRKVFFRDCEHPVLHTVVYVQQSNNTGSAAQNFRSTKVQNSAGQIVRRIALSISDNDRWSAAQGVSRAGEARSRLTADRYFPSETDRTPVPPPALR
jgi:hypothetical protein